MVIYIYIYGHWILNSQSRDIKLGSGLAGNLGISQLRLTFLFDSGFKEIYTKRTMTVFLSVRIMRRPSSSAEEKLSAPSNWKLPFGITVRQTSFSPVDT